MIQLTSPAAQIPRAGDVAFEVVCRVVHTPRPIKPPEPDEQDVDQQVQGVQRAPATFSYSVEAGDHRRLTGAAMSGSAYSLPTNATN
jgi:hypothetical protein